MDPLKAGNSIKVSLACSKDTGGPFDLTDRRVVSTIARTAGGVPLVTKTSDSADEIAIPDAPGGQLLVNLLPADTRALRGTYAFDVVAFAQDGEEHTLFQGELEFSPRVTTKPPAPPSS